MNTQKSSLDLSHFPVMLSEIIKLSSPERGGLFVDCTFGGGGYSKELLKFPKTKIIAIDRDKAVVSSAKKLVTKFNNRFEFYLMKFSELDKILKNKVDTIIFDLGLSSIQLNNFKRGFSFKSKEKLDMSMGLSNISAQEVVNNLTEIQLNLIIKTLGEENESKKIAKNIVQARSIKKITRVDELVKIIEGSKKKKFPSKINPCTKTFQALRIFVNKEISELINGIITATKLLKPGGKILIISFHSLEDKIIKFFFNNYSYNKSMPSRYLPEIENENSVLFEKYKNQVIKPSREEIINNNRSRSAKLRFATRSENQFFYPEKLVKKFNKYINIEEIYV